MQSNLDRLADAGCVHQKKPSPLRKVDEISRNFNAAEIIQVVMPAPGETDKPLRLVGPGKQPFAKSDGYRGIERTMHDEQRNPDPRDQSVRMELIADK